jgi:hypothetical protein
MESGLLRESVPLNAADRNFAKQPPIGKPGAFYGSISFL